MKLISLFLTIWIVSGCAFSMHQTELNYKYDEQSLTSKPENIKDGVLVANVADERAVSDPKIISHLVNGYGQTTSGGYVAEKEITEIVKKGITDALSSAGYTNSDDVELDAVIHDYEYDTVAGWWSVKKVTSKLDISITLKRNGEYISKNTVIGKSTLLSKDMAGKKEQELIVDLFNAALDDSITQIVEVVNIALRK
jgi:hypothetical protein